MRAAQNCWMEHGICGTYLLPSLNRLDLLYATRTARENAKTRLNYLTGGVFAALIFLFEKDKCLID